MAAIRPHDVGAHLALVPRAILIARRRRRLLVTVHQLLDSSSANLLLALLRLRSGAAQHALRHLASCLEVTRRTGPARLHP